MAEASSVDALKRGAKALGGLTGGAGIIYLMTIFATKSEFAEHKAVESERIRQLEAENKVLMQKVAILQHLAGAKFE